MLRAIVDMMAYAISGAIIAAALFAAFYEAPTTPQCRVVSESRLDHYTTTTAECEGGILVAVSKPDPMRGSPDRAAAPAVPPLAAGVAPLSAQKAETPPGKGGAF